MILCVKKHKNSNICEKKHLTTGKGQALEITQSSKDLSHHFCTKKRSRKMSLIGIEDFSMKIYEDNYIHIYVYILMYIYIYVCFKSDFKSDGEFQRRGPQ